MKDSTKDKTEGTAHEVKGKVKEEIGRAVRNPKMEYEGNDEKNAGKIQQKVGDLKKAVGS